MCCGRGVRKAASQTYVSPSSTSLTEPPVAMPEPVFIWQQQVSVPTYKEVKKVGAYYSSGKKETDPKE